MDRRRATVIFSLPIVWVVVTFGFLAFMPHSQMNYAVGLMLWFSLWLVIFHVWFWLQIPLTENAVRLIDYFYLGAAAISLFFYAHQVHEQRWDYLVKASLPPFEISELMVSLDRFVEAACSAGSTNKECSAGKEVVAKLDGRKLGVVDYLLMRERLDDLKSERFGPLVERIRSLLWLASTRLFREEKAAPKSPRLPDGGDAVLSLGQTVLWPFVLALALALRLTKVTIEIFGWSKKETLVQSQVGTAFQFPQPHE